MSLFDQFWEILPSGTRLKTEKIPAKEAWGKATKQFGGDEQTMFNALSDAVRHQVRNNHFGDDHKFAPSARKWIRNGRWMDDVRVKATSQPPDDPDPLDMDEILRLRARHDKAVLEASVERDIREQYARDHGR